MNYPRFFATYASGVFFCVSIVAGVEIKGVTTSIETDTNGVLIVPETSAMKVASTS